MIIHICTYILCIYNTYYIYHELIDFVYPLLEITANCFERFKHFEMIRIHISLERNLPLISKQRKCGWR